MRISYPKKKYWLFYVFHWKADEIPKSDIHLTHEGFVVFQKKVVNSRSHEPMCSFIVKTATFWWKMFILGLTKVSSWQNDTGFFEISRLEDTIKSREMVPSNSSFNTTQTISSEWKVTMQKLSILL